MNRVIRFQSMGGPEVLKVENTTIPEPDDNEVVVKVVAVGLNRAELLYMQGQYIVEPEFPSALGIEAAGTIYSLGANVTDFKVNDSVCLTPNIMLNEYGFTGEYVVAPKEAVVHKPAPLTFNEAAAFWTAYGSAYAGLKLRGGLQHGTDKTVLITAASSSVGVAAIQMARLLGANVIATTRSSKKRDFLLAQGADFVIATEEDNLIDEVEKISNGRGFDLAIDPIAGSMINQLAEAAAPEAKIVVYGALSPEQPSLPLYPLLLKGISLHGFHLVFHLLRHPNRVKELQDHLLEGLKKGAYKPVIDRVFPRIDQIQEAYAYMAQNQQKGKIVLEV